MDFSGLVGKFPVNRKLSEQERFHHLKQGQRMDLKPRYQLSVIRLNSTFMEVVDKWYGWKGAVTTITCFVFLVQAWIFGWLGLKFILAGFGMRASALDFDVALLNGFAFLIIFSVFSSGVFWIMCREAFAHTHYPIIFNRKNRIVYFFKTDGTVLSHPWDNLFFTICHIPISELWEVRAHILDADRQTVRETFALSHSDALPAPSTINGAKNGSEDFVRAHWEFIRRYMEEGPREILGSVQFCIPIDQRRESARFGLERIFANFAGAPRLLYMIMFPFCLTVGIFRILAMRTSKVPKWPSKVESDCAVQTNDPYAITGASDGTRIPVYPAAALTAGVIQSP